MVNRLQTKRSEKTRKLISESLKERFKKQGGHLSDEVKRKIAEKQKLNWRLKKQEENENNELNSDQNEIQ